MVGRLRFLTLNVKSTTSGGMPPGSYPIATLTGDLAPLRGMYGIAASLSSEVAVTVSADASQITINSKANALVATVVTAIYVA